MLFRSDDRHFSDNWLKNRYVRNYFKADIANRRFVSFDFESNEEYEFKNFKTSKNLNREVQYGYTSNNADNFLYRYSDRNKEIYPFDTTMGWDQKIYKELERERTFSMNFNEWGIEYINLRTKRNDIFVVRASAPCSIKSAVNFRRGPRAVQGLSV